MRRHLYILLCFIILPHLLFAQDKLTVQPIGRILMDAGIFEGNEAGLNNGISIPDFRIGAFATFGKFSAYIDVCYAREKVRMKDVCIEGKFEHLHIRIFLPSVRLSRFFQFISKSYYARTGY